MTGDHQSLASILSPSVATMFAVLSAMCTGLIFSLNTVLVNYVVRDVKYPAD